MAERQRNKHVVLVIRVLNGRSGGAERIYCELANIMQENGYDVTCLHFDKKNGKAFYPLNNEVERINLFGKKSWVIALLGAVERFLPGKLRAWVSWEVQNRFFVNQLRDYFQLIKPDVAISILPPANTPTLLAAAGTTVKVIPCNHNVPEQDYCNPKRWGSNPLDRRRRLEALDNAAAIHVLFPDFASWFPQHLKDRIVAIPNYISRDFRQPTTKPIRERTVLAVGRLADVKNYMQLLKSWALLADEFPDWKVKIFGIGPQLNELKEEIGRLGLRGRVELAGHLADLSSEYAKASIFCHPALFEGFGLSVAEALFLETPVVTYSDCSGVNEFVRDGYNGLSVDRFSVEDSLAGALRQLIIDEQLRLKLGANGPESVREFSFDRYQANWLSLVDRMESDQ